MESLKNILKKLDEAGELLNDAATDISVSDIECRTADIKHLGRALVEISEVKKTIYELSPELTPDSLKSKSSMSDLNRELGRIIVQNERSLGLNEPYDAIDRLNKFIDKCPSEFMSEIAVKEINKIKTTFNI
jgi:hypothetical protein